MKVEVRDLAKSFEANQVIKDLDMDLQPGKMTAITGVSGSGKSTLLNILGLLEPYDYGQIIYDGTSAPKAGSPASIRFIRNNISYLFQNLALLEEETVENNLRYAMRYARDKDKLSKIQKVLDFVGLSGFEKRKVFTLSGGQQARVALARALLKPGDLLLCDEPTGSLDPENRDQVLALLKQAAKANKTVVIVTHDPAVSAFCDVHYHLQ